MTTTARMRLIGLLLLALSVTAGRAQTADIDAGASIGPDASQREALRRIVGQPVPEGRTPVELRRHFADKVDAAARLADPAVQQQVLRDAIERLPSDARWPNDLAWIEYDLRRYDSAARLWGTAMQRAATPADGVFYESNRLVVWVAQRKADAAEQVADLRRRTLALLGTLEPSVDRVTALRAMGNLASRDAEIAGFNLQLAETLAARAEAERLHREAFEAMRSLDALKVSPSLRRVTAHNLAVSQRERAMVLSRLARYGEAEALLDEHRRFVQAHHLGAMLASGASHALAALRLHQGHYADAERLLLQSLQSLDDARVTRSHPIPISRSRDLVLMLWAQSRADEALRLLETLDAQVQRDGAPASRARMPFERGLVYLARGRSADAAKLFDEVARSNQSTLGAGHYFTAQAQGMHGAALWASGASASRELAAELLKQATLDLLSPRNADWLTDAGVRRPVRELIFKAYLEAMAWRGGLQAMVAMGVADRLIAGSTAQALADAALRSAAGNPALAELVRKEQDLRQQLQSVRGEDSTALDEAQRRRVADLELQRQQVQETIRARYPGYDQLLRPPLANPTDVAQRLRRDEVLVLATPGEKALHLWAVSADELPLAVRVDAKPAQLAELVARLRRGLDFAHNGGRLGRFDDAAAAELHRLVLSPLQPRLEGRRHLVLVTSGALAQIPWSVLTTGPAGADGPAWLVRRLAVSQVPSVAAWLQLRQLPPIKPAPEPLLAWADPRFAADSGAARRPAAGQPPREALRYQDLPPLPETRDEVQTIARALRADAQRDLIVGAQATRDSVIEANRNGSLARKRVLVFATHGLMAGDLPGLNQPALAMAGTAGQADPLAALLGLDDILGFKLAADWVVLSACNTAAGDGRAEEALSGLARGFLYAGGRSLLVTHWAVETESARRLTTATFEHHAANAQATKAESLRQAMLRLMADPKYAHPAYWAPFALVGDGAR